MVGSTSNTLNGRGMLTSLQKTVFLEVAKGARKRQYCMAENCITYIVMPEPVSEYM